MYVLDLTHSRFVFERVVTAYKRLEAAQINSEAGTAAGDIFKGV
jgi:hypothetical protein